MDKKGHFKGDLSIAEGFYRLSKNVPSELSQKEIVFCHENRVTKSFVLLESRISRNRTKIWILFS